MTAEIIVVTSGKGGVGKTTTSASLATGLAMAGKKIAVIDFDVGLRNLDLIMGCERRVVYDFVNVVHGEATLKQALIKDKRYDNLYVLAASQTRDKDALTQEGVEKVLDDLSARKASTTSSATRRPASRRARIWRCTSPTMPWWWSTRRSPRCATPTASSACSRARRAAPSAAKAPIKQHLLLTRYNPARVAMGEMLSVKDVEEILGIERRRRHPRVGERAGRVQRRHAGHPRRQLARRPGLRRYGRPHPRRGACRCASSTRRRRAFSSAYSEADRDGYSRFPEAQAGSHRRRRQGTSAHHRGAGALHPRRTGLPAVDAQRAARSDQEIRPRRPRSHQHQRRARQRTRDPRALGRPARRQRPGAKAG